MKITSRFPNNGEIPEIYTCKGQNINPQLMFSNVPAIAQSLALFMHDPDAPVSGGFTHWIAYNITPDTEEVHENSKPSGIESKNSSGQTQYVGPCPPSGTHHYHFMLYALDKMLEPNTVFDKDGLVRAMHGHIIEQAELIGTVTK